MFDGADLLLLLLVVVVVVVVAVLVNAFPSHILRIYGTGGGKGVVSESICQHVGIIILHFYLFQHSQL